MPLSAAEKQRRYRQRRDADPERRNNFLQKERRRWHDNKGKSASRLSVDQLTDRERRNRRKYWRKKQQTHRATQKSARNIMTPPCSPDDNGNGRRESGLRRRRARAKRSKDMKDLTEALQQERRRAERYRKRYNRLLNRTSDSPRSKTRQLLRNFHVGKSVRQTLNFHFALVSDLKAKYKASHHERRKQMVARLLTGKIVKQYRFQKFAEEIFGFSQRRWKHLVTGSTCNADPFDFKKRKMAAWASKFASRVRSFYIRDDVSRITAGKKETKTRNKQKMQKRFLCDSLKVLHMKFLSESPNMKISYSLFCRLRPFWVIIPSSKDRETCLCKTHENLNLLVQKLRDLKLLQTSDLCQMADNMACDRNQKACMYGECASCVSAQVPVAENYDELQQVEYWQWVSKKTERVLKSSEVKEQRVTSKDKISERLVDVVNLFQKQMKQFQRHLFNIRHQFASLRQLKENLKDNECIIQLDFAENYLCQYATEIQSAHFGASHQQVTLHDVVLQVGNIPEAIAMCTMSPSLQHDPPAIWTYLEPVFQYIKTKFPKVDTLHFYSDGPSTQYRQKKNFFLFCTKIYQHGFSSATWNFFEAGHGKGAPDGVGGSIKRAADRLVNAGIDIPDAKKMFGELTKSETKVKMFFTDSSSVTNATKMLPENIVTVPGTMGIHQICTTKMGSMYYRQISCFCSHPDTLRCSCYDAKEFVFPTSEMTTPQQPTHEPSHTGLTPLDITDPDVIGKWCVVKYMYDGKYYPGIVTGVDEEDVEVKCMSAVGENRFFWSRFDDVVWYRHEDVICTIPEPCKIGTRHLQIDKEIWSKIN
ncbi:uncharacterized protein LOC135467176 [Liolophura sinensis]|uniref:uncharacterized protein LOC135467176 n=1 Tax=Liolophura sinensis TaxID=3198878 RepID=UPI003158B442